MEKKGVIFSNKDGTFKRLGNGAVVPYYPSFYARGCKTERMQCSKPKKSYKTQ